MGANNSEKGKARLKDEPTRTAELIARCILGDEATWGLFVRQWGSIIVHTIEYTLHHFDVQEPKETVEDLTQNVFFHLVANDYGCLRSFDPGRARFRTYLTIITRNIVIDYLRQRRLSAVALDESVCAVAVYESAMQALDIPERLLSPRQALVLRLLYGDGLSAKGVAETLGSTVQAVYEVKSKALKKLRRALSRNRRYSRSSSGKSRAPAHDRGDIGRARAVR
jgi:RNA polymerase sigma-70 factor (ECF subfamily)